MPTVRLPLRRFQARQWPDFVAMALAVIFPIAFLTVPGLAHNLVGLSLFVLNLGLLAWVVRSLWRAQPREAARGTSHD